jgi:hypothetical protein
MPPTAPFHFIHSLGSSPISKNAGFGAAKRRRYRRKDLFAEDSKRFSSAICCSNQLISAANSVAALR